MKIKRYMKIVVNIFKVFGFDAFRIFIWLAFDRAFHKKVVKSVYCRNLGKRVYIRVGSTDVILIVLMFCVDCDADGRREYDIDLGSSRIEYIIDAGSNIGLFSLLYAKKYPDAKIICIEPDEDNFRILSMNVSNNKNIILLNKGLWSSMTNLEIVDRDAESWGFVVKEVTGEGQKPELGLQAVTIFAIMEEYQFPRIDILKLDIEGSEYEVFSESCNEWINNVNMIFIEIHGDIITGCDQRVTDVMRQYGFVEQKRNGENRIFFRK